MFYFLTLGMISLSSSFTKPLVIAPYVPHLYVYNPPLHIKVEFDAMNIMGVVVHTKNLKQ